MVNYKRLFSSLAGLAVVTMTTAHPFDSGHPILPKISNPSPYAGELVLVTVPLSGAATTDDTLAITTTTPGNFDSLVTSVNYYVGDTSVSFYAQIDPYAIGDIQLTATNENGSAGTLVALHVGYLAELPPVGSIIESMRF
jgi:hypothetical protein